MMMMTTMTSELQRAQPLASVPGHRSFLFYGPGGTGKTSLAIKHPGKKKLFIDVDQRLHELNLSKEELNGVTVWTPGVGLAKEVQLRDVDPTRRDVYNKGTKISTKPEGYERTIALINELLALKYAGTFDFDLVVLDSLTRLVDHLIYAIMYKHGVTNMTQTLFGVEGSNLKDALVGFLELPCDRIVIAHAAHKEKRDEQTGAVIWEKIRPHIYGSDVLRDELPTMFTEVYYFLGYNHGKKKYLIQTKNDRLAPARTAKNLEFEQEIDPSKIFA